MALTPKQAEDTARELLTMWRDERPRLDHIDNYLHGVHRGPYMPKETHDEYQQLADRSKAPVLPLILDQLTQALYVEDFRPSRERREPAEAELLGEPAEEETPRGWEYWQQNRMDDRQSAVHRASLGYGLSYVTVLPGEPVPVIRGSSPRRMIAAYDDAVNDEWPVAALDVAYSLGNWTLRLYDDRYVHHFHIGATAQYVWPGAGTARPMPNARDLTYLRSEAHNAGVVPVVRFPDNLDLEGRCFGQIEPLIPLQDRLDQTIFDLLMAQTYASFKVRVFTGLNLPDADDDARAKKLQLAMDRVLTAEDPDSRASTLDETPLEPFINAAEFAVRQIAVISQVPPQALLGQLVNLSAEALAAAESGMMRKVNDHKRIFGESWEQVIRLCSLLDGDRAGWEDTKAEIQWRDIESRSLAQTADAFVKLSNIGVPFEALWERIPGVSRTDVERWKQMAAEQDAVANLTAMLSQQAAPLDEDEQAEPQQPQASTNGAGPAG